VQRVWLLRGTAILLGLVGLAASDASQSGTLEPSAQARIRAATFEVVQRKPEEDPVISYDRPLPMELMPYQERTDKYRSIGTAFAIGANRYVTAGHVFSLGKGSQFGPPALRDADGTVYEIDKLWKYSDGEDFVEFSLRSEPKGVQILEIGPVPALNDAVFTAGNALGEGVVIRDGVYTSDTPEEQNGEWKWLRFSAAASPGNSGGPLLDQAGRVIGVVLRKSESENLNYALPIARVSASKEGEGRLDGRSPIRLPVMDVAETLTIHQRIPLPASPQQFYAALQSVMIEQIVSAQRQLLVHNQQRLFPDSATSAQLLHTRYSAAFPRIIHESQDGVWAAGSEKTESFQLDHNGFVETARGLVRLRLPDDISLGTLYGDSKLYMDLLLKGYPVRRQIGSESVKVTSLGKAQWSSNFTDSYGRTWQMHAWAEPWADVLLVAVSLPTPEGYVGFLIPITTGFKDLLIETQKLMVNFVYLTMGGTLSQWRDYLAQKNVAPKIFSTLKLEIDPEHDVRFRSKRCELNVTPELLQLSRDSMLWLNFSYYRDGGAVVWDIAGVSLEQSAQKHNWVETARVSEPDAGLPQGFQSNWAKLLAREYPYNATVFNSNGETRINTVADAAGAADQAAKIHYTLTLVGEGEQSQDAMSPRLELLRRSFKELE